VNALHRLGGPKGMAMAITPDWKFFYNCYVCIGAELIDFTKSC
jgi:hypothetical protein